MEHADHKPQLVRLKRIEGQVRGISKMIEDGKYCVNILHQVKAIRSSLKGLEEQILENHINHCVRSAIDSDDKSKSEELVREIVDLVKKTSKL
ncbi:MAG: metal-sensitive transcriptional regulator [Bacteriovoracaceae bacterium]|nr:metal-sensitive transcriptional regulator [Bacteriovoracaceae bacterium]